MSQQTTRYRAVAAIVVGLLVVLAIFLVVALLLGGDDTGEIDPQNGARLSAPTTE